MDNIELGEIFNTSVTANTDFFETALDSKMDPSFIRIYITLDTSGIISIRRGKGGTTISEKLNSGIALVADSPYIFDIYVDPDETINIRTDINAICLKCKVMEIKE